MSDEERIKDTTLEDSHPVFIAEGSAMHRVALSSGSVPLNEPFAPCGVTKDWVWLQSLEAETYQAALIARFGLT